MTNTRIIRPIPLGPTIAPQGCVLYDKYIDYITTDDKVPADAIYAAKLDAGRYTEVKAAPRDFAMIHAFAGWQDALSTEEKAAAILKDAVPLSTAEIAKVVETTVTKVAVGEVITK